MPKAETPDPEEDDLSEMDEWEWEVITHFGEKVRQNREEKRRTVVIAGTRRMT